MDMSLRLTARTSKGFRLLVGVLLVACVVAVGFATGNVSCETLYKLPGDAPSTLAGADSETSNNCAHYIQTGGKPGFSIKILGLSFGKDAASGRWVCVDKPGVQAGSMPSTR
jgi:hypothetical protein